jgi:DNA-binding MarR family transcriptional regulator
LPRPSAKATPGRGLGYSNPADPVELGYRPGHLIWRVQQQSWRTFAKVVGRRGVTPVQASVLMVVHSHPGIDQKTLAEAVALDRATTGNVVGRLEARGLIQRVTPPSDRRARSLFLTKAGRTLNRSLGAVTRRARSLLVQDLAPDEREELIRLLRKLLRIKDHPAAPGPQQAGTTPQARKRTAQDRNRRRPAAKAGQIPRRSS